MEDKEEDKIETRMWSRKIGGDHSATITIPSYIIKNLGLKKGDYVLIKYNIYKKNEKTIHGDPYFIVDKNL